MLDFCYVLDGFGMRLNNFSIDIYWFCDITKKYLNNYEIIYWSPEDKSYWLCWSHDFFFGRFVAFREMSLQLYYHDFFNDFCNFFLFSLVPLLGQLFQFCPKLCLVTKSLQNKQHSKQSWLYLVLSWWTKILNILSIIPATWHSAIVHMNNISI